MQTVSRWIEADWKVSEIEGTEWKLATRNSLKGEKRALQCELIYSWFLFILQILQIAQVVITSRCSTTPGAVPSRGCFAKDGA